MAMAEFVWFLEKVKQVSHLILSVIFPCHFVNTGSDW